MKKPVIAGAFLLLCFIAAAAHAASFDCKKASTEVEKMICADARLSKLDEELAVTYRDTAGKAAPTEKAALRKEQATWLKSRNACKENLCIEVMYRTRLAMLASAATERPRAQAGTPGVSLYGRFWLTYGHGAKVCEAYLERLNRSSYEHHPKCDRPENGEVPGFRALNRVRLGAEEVQPFWASVSTFLASGQIQDWKRGDEESRKLGLRPRFGNVDEQLKAIRGESTLSVFRYAPPIDIDNDGVADVAVTWRSGNCAPLGPLQQMDYWSSIPVVLNGIGDGPDVDRTRQLVGHPSGGYRLPSGKVANKFRPIGRHMSIFEFERTYYMDTFFDGWGDFSGHRQYDAELGKYDPEIASRLAVFLRRGSETKQVCEYWFEEYSESAQRGSR